MMNSAVYSRVMTKKNGRMRAVPIVSGSEIKLDQSKPVQEYLTLAEKIAKSTIYVLNWYVPEGKVLFPYHDRMRRVDKYFPYAVNGPLLVDEANSPSELASLERKREYIKKSGYRYVILELSPSGHVDANGIRLKENTDLYDALKQLEEI